MASVGLCWMSPLFLTLAFLNFIATITGRTECFLVTGRLRCPTEQRKTVGVEIDLLDDDRGFTSNHIKLIDYVWSSLKAFIISIFEDKACLSKFWWNKFRCSKRNLITWIICRPFLFSFLCWKGFENSFSRKFDEVGQNLYCPYYIVPL